MSYKNQIIKEIVNSKCDRKTYADLIKRRNNTPKVTTSDKIYINKVYPIIKNYPITDNTSSDINTDPATNISALQTKLAELQQDAIDIGMEITMLKARQEEIISKIDTLSAQLSYD